MKKASPYPNSIWLPWIVGVPFALILVGFVLVVLNADELEFDKAQWWWLVGVGPLAWLIVWWGVTRRRQALTNFTSQQLAPLLTQGLTASRQAFRSALMICAMLLIAAAIIGPRWGIYLEKQKVYGIDIVVALDVSRSMLAQDVKPNRLELAKQIIRQQLTERTVFGHTNRTALITFAGSTSLKVPLTTDHLTFRNRLRTIQVGSAPRGGTALAKAIEAATDLFAKSPEQATKIILLLTDGEDHEGDPIQAAQQAYKEFGIRTFAIGVGDPSLPAGAQIPVVEGGRVKPLVYEGQIVFTKLDIPGLQSIGRAGEGRYAPIRDLPRLVDAIAGRYRTELSTEQRTLHKPRYQWLLAAALIMLMIESLIRERGFSKDAHPQRVWQQEGV